MLCAYVYLCCTITCRHCHYIDHGLILDYYGDVLFILLHVLLLKLLIITLTLNSINLHLYNFS